MSAKRGAELGWVIAGLLLAIILAAVLWYQNTIKPVLDAGRILVSIFGRAGGDQNAPNPKHQTAKKPRTANKRRNGKESEIPDRDETAD